MKSPFRFSILLFALFLITDSCKKDDDIITEEPTNNTELQSVNVTVNLPSGSDLDLTTTEIVSVGQLFDVSSNGEATILINPSNPTMVSLQDKVGGVILMGFIDENNTVISIESTVKVSLYFALGTFMNYDGVKDLFFENYLENEEINTLINDISTNFLSNPLFIEQGAFAEMVVATADKLIEREDIFDVGRGVIVDSEEKSKIKVTNAGTDAIGFQSRSRRRAHAFIYKVKQKIGVNEPFLTLIESIEGDVLSNKDVKIETVNGFTSFFGTIWDNIAGNGLEVAIKDTAPVSLPLVDSEVEVIYSVRVIGPSGPNNIQLINNLTNAEGDKLIDLQLKTFLLDVLYPLFAVILGAEDAPVDETSLELFQTIMTSLMGSSTIELVVEGNFKEALMSFYTEFTTSILSGVADENLNNLLNWFEDYFKLSNVADGDVIEKVFAPLKIIDAFLASNDVITRITKDVILANPIEEWEVIISNTNDLTCVPDKTIIHTDEIVNIEARVGDLQLSTNQQIQYEWQIIGNEYGGLKNPEFDPNSYSSLTTIGDDNDIIFEPTITEEEIASGDVVQQITTVAKIYENDVLVSTAGNDTTDIRITQKNWKIRPGEVILAGGQSVVLRVVDDNNMLVVPPGNFTQQIEWSSSARHGDFDFSSVFQENGGAGTYNCYDYDTEEGIEDVTARIIWYSPNTNQTIVRDIVDGSISIKNDPNVKYLYVPATYDLIDDPSCEGCYFYAVYFEFPPQENAVSYHLTVKELVFGNNSTSFIGLGPDWIDGNPNDLTNGNYRYNTYFGGGPASSQPAVAALLASMYGYAEVRVVLE